MEGPSSSSFEAEHDDLLKLSLSVGSTSQPEAEPPAPPLYAREEHDQWLQLSLSTASTSHTQPLYDVPTQPTPFASIISPQELHQQCFSVQPYPPLFHPHIVDDRDKYQDQDQDPAGPSRQGRARKRKAPKEGKSAVITPPYPWATSSRARVYSIELLLSKRINLITGEVRCRKCEKQYTIEYDLQKKFSEVAAFVAENKCIMHDRAPSVWLNPEPLNCKLCGIDKCVSPVIEKKKAVNWLFLLLGQMIGFCNLPHLKYFCKHTGAHRTGAKDRVLYLTYLGLCKQLEPNGPFDL